MKKIVLHKFIIVLPVFYIFWGVFVFHLGGPVYLSRIDPEFPYLLNGLNCAIFEFNRIGHVDHPGTPFQLITGIFIGVIYLFAGHSSIVESVFGNPEMYFVWSALFLTIITAWTLLWLGRIMLKYTHDIFGTIILQSSLFFSFPLIDVPYRYFPDRLLIIIMLVFIGLCIKLFYGNFKIRRFTIGSGILMGMGFVTKFVFLPFLIIPLIIIKSWKEKIRYLMVLGVSCVLFFLPVLNKFTYFKNFIIGLITHEGQYGSGGKQIINIDKFTANLGIMALDNLVYLILLLLSVGIVLVLYLKPDFRQKFTNEYLFLMAIIITAVVSIIMIGKHYKSHYMDSLLITSGFVFYILWRISKSQSWGFYTKYIFYFSFVLILYSSTNTLYPGYKFRQYCYEDNKMTSLAIHKLISTDDYLFVEPTWQSGPFLTNGLVYGLSYVFNRALYFNQFEKLYPYLLTYEGFDKPMKYARMIDADNEAILKSGKSIFIHSTPGRNAHILLQYLNNEASKYESILSIDTVYYNKNNEEYFIRVKNSNWAIKSQFFTGFEKIKNGIIYTDDEKESLKDGFIIDNKEFCNGTNSIKLGKQQSHSPKFILQDVHQGDYIELTIKRRKNEQDDKGSLVINFKNENQKTTNCSNGEKLSVISSNWEIVRLSTTIDIRPINNSIECYYRYKGNQDVYIDDFTMKHFGRK